MNQDKGFYIMELNQRIAVLKAEAQELHDKYGKLWDENKRQAEELKKLQAFWEQSRLTERVSFIRAYRETKRSPVEGGEGKNTRGGGVSRTAS